MRFRFANVWCVAQLGGNTEVIVVIMTIRKEGIVYIRCPDHCDGFAKAFAF